MKNRIYICFLMISLSLAGFASLQSAYAADLATAKAQGLVGERPDGLIGTVSENVTTDVLDLVDTVNAERLARYKAIAAKNGTPVDKVQALAGSKLIGQTPDGQYIMNAAGDWQRK